jgi:hypothetical protein
MGGDETNWVCERTDRPTPQARRLWVHRAGTRRNPDQVSVVDGRAGAEQFPELLARAGVALVRWPWCLRASTMCVAATTYRCRKHGLRQREADSTRARTPPSPAERDRSKTPIFRDGESQTLTTPISGAAIAPVRLCARVLGAVRPTHRPSAPLRLSCRPGGPRRAPTPGRRRRWLAWLTAASSTSCVSLALWCRCSSGLADATGV